MHQAKKAQVLGGKAASQPSKTLVSALGSKLG